METQKPELDKRKAFILATVVYEYINTGEPVGSLTLTQKYNLGVSSATIRNEMAELESGGYLTQLHTSSGRVPSDSGYRTYVDQLMEPVQLEPEEQLRIREEYRAASMRLDDVIESTTKMLSRLSRNLAFVVAPARAAQTFRHIQLIWTGPRGGFAVVVSSLGVAAQINFEADFEMGVDELTKLSNVLNVRLSGRVLRDITHELITEAIAEAGLAGGYGAIVDHALRAATQGENLPEILASGAGNLLDQPEFHDLRTLRSILKIVEEQKVLYDLVADSFERLSPLVKIGHELGTDEMTDCSIVTIPYHVGEATGMLAILGPRRMPYARMIALAAGTAQTLNAHLNENELR